MVEALLTILDCLGGEAQTIARHPGRQIGAAKERG